MVPSGSMIVTPSVESQVFERPLSTPENVLVSSPPTMARPVIQNVTLVKTRKNPKLPPLGNNVGLKRKRGAQKKSLDLGVEASSYKELQNDLINDKE